MLGTDPGGCRASLRLPPEYRHRRRRPPPTIGSFPCRSPRLMHAYMDSLSLRATENTGRDAISPYDPLPREEPAAGHARTPGESDARVLPAPAGARSAEARPSLRVGERRRRRRLRAAHAEIPVRPRPAEGAPGLLHAARPRRTHAPTPATASRATRRRSSPITGVHNNGVSQAEYDGVFGRGALCRARRFPGLSRAERSTSDALSPPLADASEGNQSIPVGTVGAQPGPCRPRRLERSSTNPDMPKPQAALTQDPVRAVRSSRCETVAQPAAAATARRSRPSKRRRSGTSANRIRTSIPAASTTIEDVLRFYVTDVRASRAPGRSPHAAPELSGIHIDAQPTRSRSRPS